MKLPEDANILFSYINTLLRDRYPSLEALCEGEEIEMEELEKRLSFAIYDRTLNAFRY